MEFLENDHDLAVGADQFATTHWTVVLTAGQCSSPQADAALARLCRTYWYPLYAFVRRQGHNLHDAQDLTQAFFERFLEKRFLDQVDRRRGKFRSFLLAALKHFLANEWDRVRASKRGGDLPHVSLDDPEAEVRYRLEAAESLTADELYDRRWALTVIDRALGRLRQDFAAAGKAHFFDRLKGFLTNEHRSVSYVELARELQQSEGSLKVMVHRMRLRYRDLVRDEIAQTVASRDAIDEELSYLLKVLRL